jgi:hypothetical protein
LVREHREGSLEAVVKTSERGQVMRLNLASRAARWSAAHWKTATFGWIAFVIAAVVIGGAIGTKPIGDGDSPGESGRMARILEDGFEEPASESVLVQSDTTTAASSPRSPTFSKSRRPDA